MSSNQEQTERSQNDDATEDIRRQEAGDVGGEESMGGTAASAERVSDSDLGPDPGSSDRPRDSGEVY